MRDDNILPIPQKRTGSERIKMEKKQLKGFKLVIISLLALVFIFSWIPLNCAFLDDFASDLTGVLTSGTNKKSGNNQGNGINLALEFGAPGNSIYLPTSDSRYIKGFVTDSDSDGTGDGLNIGGGDEPEIEFNLIGTLNTKLSPAENETAIKNGKSSSNNNPTSVDFWFIGQENDIFYFIVDGDQVGMSTVSDGSTANVTFVVTDTGFQGLLTASEASGGNILVITIIEGLQPAEIMDENGNFFYPACGNGSIDTQEECDDGNIITGDGCSDICRWEDEPFCGDGIIDTDLGEDCDDGNLENGDGCSEFCSYEDFYIGGNVSGLAGTGLNLDLNGVEVLPITTNGEFTFNTVYPDGTTYIVTVSQQPSTPPQQCDVVNGTGTIAGVNVTNISIMCTTITPGIFVNPVTGLITDEAGTAASFTVVLDTAPTADVSITLSTSDAGEGSPAPATLTFMPSTWDIPQTVSVTGADDFIIDGDQDYIITLSPATSADTDYSGIDPPDVTVTNIDNDVADIIVTPTSGLTTDESGLTANFTVVLASEPSAVVTINLSSDTPTEGAVVPLSMDFDMLNWNVPQNATVTGVPDVVIDPDTDYWIILTASSTDANYTVIDPPDVLVTNINIDVK
jgi:cysteine-rich repeat protein